MNSERPHAAPCNCWECVTWARAIIAAPATRKLSAPLPRGEDIPLVTVMRHAFALACKATGLSESELQAHAEYTGEELVSRRQLEITERATVAARGVPEIHIRAIWDSPPVECEALHAVQDFVYADKTLLVLSGGVGLRKTGSACWALTRKPGRFVTADEILRLVVSRTPEDIALWRRVRDAQLLVIDDLGGEYSDDKGWSVKVINSLLDHRYAAALKTVITTNLEPAPFAVDYGQRVADRVRESGKFIHLGGTSVRRVRAGSP